MPKNNSPVDNKRSQSGFDPEDYTNSATVCECTGLIPSAPLNDDEYESYDAVYNFMPMPSDKKAED